MKNIIISAALLVATICNSQEIKLQLTNKGFIELPVVVNLENKNSTEIYSSIIKWVNRNYQNPESVIKAKIENELIRIEGINNTASSIKSGLNQNLDIFLKYTLEIEIKDNKYRINVYNLSSAYDSHRIIFDKNGALRKRSEDAPRIKLDIENSINNLLNSLSSEVLGINKSNW